MRDPPTPSIPRATEDTMSDEKEQGARSATKDFQYAYCCIN